MSLSIFYPKCVHFLNERKNKIFECNFTKVANEDNNRGEKRGKNDDEEEANKKRRISTD